MHEIDGHKNIYCIFLLFKMNFEFIDDEFNQKPSIDPIATGKNLDDSEQMEIPEPVLVLEIEFVETTSTG